MSKRISAAQHGPAQDACTKIVVLAERRIGLELIEAQKRGELLGPSEGNTLRRRIADGNSHPATLDDVGLKSFEAHRFKQMADLDETDVEEVASDARERRRPVTKAAAKRSQPTCRMANCWKV